MKSVFRGEFPRLIMTYLKFHKFLNCEWRNYTLIPPYTWAFTRLINHWSSPRSSPNPGLKNDLFWISMHYPEIYCYHLSKQLHLILPRDITTRHPFCPFPALDALGQEGRCDAAQGDVRTSNHQRAGWCSMITIISSPSYNSIVIDST